jgi:hypothetical protein
MNVCCCNVLVTSILIMPSFLVRMDPLPMKVFLYEIGHIWSCVGSLIFKACLGACLFYWPPRTEHKCKEDYEVLFVNTSDGLQAHILPNLVETKSSPQRSGTTKIMH